MLSLGLVVPITSYAIGLGDLHVLSGKGEPFSAEIPIHTRSHNHPVDFTARMAGTNKYQMLHIKKPNSVGQWDVSVSHGDHPVILIKSPIPISRSGVTFLIDLHWNGGTMVKEYSAYPSITGTASYNGNAPIIAVQHAEPIHTMQQDENGAQSITLHSGGSLYHVANSLTTMYPKSGISQIMAAIFNKNKSLFIDDNPNLIRSGVTLQLPSNHTVQAVTQEESAAYISMQVAMWHRMQNNVEEKRKAANKVTRLPAKTAATHISTVAPVAPTASGATKPITAPKPVYANHLQLSSAPAVAVGKQQPAPTAATISHSVIEHHQKVTNSTKVSELLLVWGYRRRKFGMEHGDGLINYSERRPSESNDGISLAQKSIAEFFSKKNNKRTASQEEQDPQEKETQGEQDQLISYVDIPDHSVADDGPATYTQTDRGVLLDDSVDNQKDAGTPISVAADAVADREPQVVTSVPATNVAEETHGVADTFRVDPVEQAEIYLNYGKNDQAIGVLQDALDESPSRKDIYSKLLGLYADGGFKNNFLELAERMRGRFGPNNTEWKKVAELGAGLFPGNALFVTENGATIETGNVAETSGKDKENIEAPITADKPESVVLPDVIEFDLGSAFHHDHVNSLIDVNEQEESQLLEGISQKLESLSSSINGTANVTDTDGVIVQNDVPVQPDQKDVTNEDEKITGSLYWDHQGTKLDLAKAYIEMGEKDEGRSLLEELIKDCPPALRDEALQLLSKC